LRLITRLNIGGPARQALLLTRALAEDFPTLLAAGRPTEVEGELLDDSVALHRLPLVRQPDPVADLRAAHEIRRLLVGSSFKLVHTHMAKAGAVGRMVARTVTPRPRTVHTFHGHVLEGYFRPRVQAAFIEAERRLARTTDVLVAVSPEIRDELVDLGIGRPSQYRVVPLGLDLSPFLRVRQPSGQLRAQLGLGPEVPLVGIVGRLVPIKDHGTLLRSLASLDGVHLAVIGDGELRADLEQMARDLGIADRTHFTGWWGDVPAAVSDLDVVALSSLNEGTPVALIEALAGGRPVVATAVGGVPSVVVDGVNGILVPSRAVGPLADALERVLDDPGLRTRFGDEGRQSVAERFGQDRLVADIRGLYEELLASPASTGRRKRGPAPRLRPSRPIPPVAEANRQEPIHVLALATFPAHAAATRYRLVQFQEPLAERGVTLEIDCFLDGRTFASLYDRTAWVRTAAGLARGLLNRRHSLVRARRADVVLVQREAMLFGPPLIEWAAARLGRCPLVLDLDDATYVGYRSPTYGWFATALKWPGKTNALIRRAAVVICGSPPVADHVRSLGTPAVVLPTVVDTDRFHPARPSDAGSPLIGWVGSHSTYPYLQSVFPALEELARTRRFRLLVVGAGQEEISLPGIEVDNRPWRLESEVADFQSCDIGLYPIVDDGWSAGKSGLKAVQYMAVGVPFVASPQVDWLGEEGVTHLAARHSRDWFDALAGLLDDARLRRRMGDAGRRHAVSHHGLDQAADTMAAVLRGTLAPDERV